MSGPEPSLWAAVDNYFAHAFAIDADVPLAQALAHQKAHGLPDINVAPNQGRLLMLLAQLGNATRILEVGTLGAYSTIWLARAVQGKPGAQVISLELEEKHAAVARHNLANAGVSDWVQVRVGRAIDSLAALDGDAFDLVFIDADKESNADYFEAALRLTKPGSLIVVDNVVRQGAVVEPDHPDSRVHGVRRLVDRVAREPSVTATTIQTVGVKGHDGLMVIRVN